MQDIHGPNLIQVIRRRLIIELTPYQALKGLVPQIEPAFLNPMHPVADLAKPFDLTKIELAQPETLIAMNARQAQQLICNLVIVCAYLEQIEVARLAEPKATNVWKMLKAFDIFSSVGKSTYHINFVRLHPKIGRQNWQSNYGS